ncbi:MAG TPA: ADP-ribosylglycohydrolase family protein [Chloroflexota bacterium]|nr:ADP-ribosylglycohydrolase family protein [Chloroflexota bacterium]
MPDHTLPTDDPIARRARGCLLGQFAGDALGSMVEFKSAADIRRLYPDGLRLIGTSPVWRTLPGQPTDDSELALALARSLVVVGDFEAEAVAGAYVDWLASIPFDVGNTIGHALGALSRARAKGGSLVQAARDAGPSTSEANGALMRQSPLAIFGAALPSAALDRHIRADTVLTHPHQVCQDASAAFAVALAAVIRDGLSGETAYEAACAWDREHGSSPTVTATLAAARTSPPEFGRNSGHVLVALQNAFFQALHAAGFEEGVTATVMGGGDTDTNGAIAGALLGALHGPDAIPPQWREAVLTCRPQQGTPGVLQPRPEVYWPIDAGELAGKLLRIGRARAS